MTLKDRVEAYNDTHPHWPASHLRLVREQDRDVIYGTWVIGSLYRNLTEYHGAYPRGYLERVASMFPDLYTPANAHRILHAFSGSLPKGPYIRLDYHHEPYHPELLGSVYEIDRLTAGTFDLICSDPPYTAEDAAIYRTPPLNRLLALEALAKVTRGGAFHVWLDDRWPMHNKLRWETVGRIWVIRSTNHIFRGVTIFQRVE